MGVKGKGKGTGKKGAGLAYMQKQAESTVPTPSVLLNGKVLEWFCINDVVMGGQSAASVAANPNGFLAFEGEVSTVGGGFCSCRTRNGDSPLGLGPDATGLKLTYVSDELAQHRYKVSLSAGDMQSRNVSWQCELPEIAGRNCVDLPFCKFRASIHGQPQEGVSFNPADITSFGINCSVFDMGGSRVEQLNGGAFKFVLEQIEAVTEESSKRQKTEESSQSSIWTCCTGR